MKFIINNIIFSLLFSGIFFLGNKMNFATENMFDMANSTFLFIDFMITTIATLFISSKIEV